MPLSFDGSKGRAGHLDAHEKRRIPKKHRTSCCDYVSFPEKMNRTRKLELSAVKKRSPTPPEKSSETPSGLGSCEIGHGLLALSEGDTSQSTRTRQHVCVCVLLEGTLYKEWYETNQSGFGCYYGNVATSSRAFAVGGGGGYCDK